MAPDSRLIISVKEARKLLGKDASKMTDQEVEKLIIDLDEIARLYFKEIREGKIKIPPKKNQTNK